MAQAMEEVRLDDVLALGEQLAALDEAGVPLELGFRRPVRPAIERIGAALTRRTNQGQTLAEAIASPELDAPEGYRRLVAEWTAGADLTTALESRRELGSRSDSYRGRMTLGLFYPAMITLLACIGAAVMARCLTPIFESTYEQLNEPVGQAVTRLQWLRETTPVWLLLAAAAVVLGVLWLRRSPALWVTRSSRPLGPASRSRLARASGDAADLVESGVAAPEALRLAGLGGGNGRMKLPPLLSWAQQNAAPDNLRAVGDVYEDMAQLGTDRFTTYAPMLALVVIGGGATLLYALTLFGPLVELLERLAY